MSSFLKQIRPYILERCDVLDRKKLEQALKTSRTPHDFLAAFRQKPAVIAEVKFASPSRGTICTAADPLSIADRYLKSGAQALSILTEPHFFKGQIDYLAQIRKKHPDSLLLMKDFILDEVQLLQARVYGADAILLIAAFLCDAKLAGLHAKALSLGLTPLVEVHTHYELMRVLEISPRLIGINNRDLHTLEISLQRSADLIQEVPESSFAISESGIRSRDEIEELLSLGFDGFLIGSSLMEKDDPGAFLASLSSGGRRAY